MATPRPDPYQDMDTDPLRTFAIPVEPIQFSTTPIVNHATSSKSRGSKTASMPAVPPGYAEQTEQSDSSATSPSADPDPQDLTEQDGETPSRRPVKNTTSNQAHSTETQNIPNAATPSTPSNPQFQTQSATNPPHLIPTYTPRTTTSGSLYQNLSSTGSSLVWKNSTSSLPNGSPRHLSKHSQVYTTPKGVIRADPWSSKHNDPNTTPGSVAPTEPETPGPVNPFSDTFPLVIDPPDLDEWRHKLFNVTDTLVLSEEEYLTYFPHVDNVYSHRSTQRYKRKAFVSHYWDCRLKGRPSGTPKSDDPNKKKRKRQARERDLCDVKIKITEYFSAEEAAKQGLHTGTSDMPPLFNGNIAPELLGDSSSTAPVPTNNDEEHDLTIVLEDGSNNPTNPTDNFGLLELPRKFPKGHPGADGKRWFAIQRVRGNPGGGALSEQKRHSISTNGATGVDGGEDEDGDTSMLDPNMAADSNHKHSLDDSDRIKKNSIERWVIKEEKEKKRLSVSRSIMFWRFVNCDLPETIIMHPGDSGSVWDGFVIALLLWKYQLSNTFLFSHRKSTQTRPHPVPTKQPSPNPSHRPFVPVAWLGSRRVRTPNPYHLKSLSLPTVSAPLHSESGLLWSSRVSRTKWWKSCQIIWTNFDQQRCWR